MEEDAVPIPRQMFSSGSRVKTPQAKPVRDLKPKVKQLIAPKDEKVTSRNLVVNTSEKSDIHLRGDLLKPTEMIRIHSANRTSRPASTTRTLEIDDESALSPGMFNFDEMLRVGRPERDTTLRVPLMRSLQALRRYKMGTSPSLKTGMLRNQLVSSIANEQTKRLLADLSATGRPGSPLLSNAMANLNFTDDVTESTNHLAHAKSAPNLRVTKGTDKEITVKAGNNVNLYLYHLSSQGKRTVKSSAKTTGAGDLGTNSLDLNTVTAAGEEGAAPAAAEIVVDAVLPAMYDPSTVRLPRMELVPGFGTTTPLVESKLGAYRVHSSKAVTAAAALEEASFTELDSSPSHSISRGGCDDSYQTERMESFYKSAETSMLNSLTNSVERHRQQQDQEQAGAVAAEVNSVNSSHEGSSIRSIVHVATTPASPQKRGLHCSKCFTTANMWCAQCAAAFCSVCWGQVLHHDLRQMSPSRQRARTPGARPQTEGGGSPESVHPVGRSPVKNSYSKSILFQPFLPNTAAPGGNYANEGKYNQTSAAKIPLPDYVITQYDEYPAPPVFIDGKGHVYEDTIKQRPYTAPVQTQQELHALQMSNHFKRASQKEQYHQMMINKYKANTIGAPSTEGGGGGSNAFVGVTSGIHYEQADPLPMAHSKGKVVVRKNKKKFAKLRPVSSSANADGTLSVGYGLKPRITSKPLTGILRDGTPEDWKTALFAGNDIGKEGTAAAGRASSGGGRVSASK